MEYIDHPNHYNRPERKECIEEMIDMWGKEAVAIFCLLNSHKYLYRAGLKDNTHQDIQKAEWYIKKYNQLAKEIGNYGT